MNAWDSGGGVGAASAISYRTHNGPVRSSVEQPPAQLPHNMGYADAARQLSDNTRQRMLRNMGTSADSIFHRNPEPMPTGQRAAADSEPPASTSVYATEYNSQFYAYAPTRPFVPRPTYNSYEPPPATQPANASAFFDQPRHASPPEPVQTVAVLPAPPPEPEPAAEPAAEPLPPRPWHNNRPSKKNWNAKYAKQLSKQLRRADVSSRDLPDSSISGALNAERPPFHCYGRGNAVHSLPGGELPPNVSLRQGCARDRTTHNVNATPYAKVFRCYHQSPLR